MTQVITTEKAPTALGPYSQAIAANGFVFVSGQIPINPATGTLLSASISEETKQVLNNVKEILLSAGSNLSCVVKTTVFLQDMKDFDEMNKAYAECFGSHKPARATIQVAALPKGARVEIEAIAKLA